VHFVCDTASSRCAGEPCGSDEDCDARFLGQTACTANADCTTPNTHCIDSDQSGASGTNGTCDSFEATAGACAVGTLVSMKDITGAAVDVCVFVEQTCNGDSLCESPAPPDCATDDDCRPGGIGTAVCDTAGTHQCVQCLGNDDCATAAGGTTCYTATHTCGCTDNTECGDAGTAPSVCNTDNGSCGCASNDECTGSAAGDICDTTTNTCGCTAAGDCGGTPTFDNTSYVCE